MDLTHIFESPSAQIIFDPSPNGSYMEDVSRTASLGNSSACPASYSSPAPAFLVRLDRLSAFVGLRGSMNPFFEMHLFIHAARKLLLPLLDTFSDSEPHRDSGNLFRSVPYIRHFHPMMSLMSLTSPLLPLCWFLQLCNQHRHHYLIPSEIYCLNHSIRLQCAPPSYHQP